MKKLLGVSLWLLYLFALPSRVHAEWFVKPEPALNLGDYESWDGLHVFAPSVVFNGSQYLMWYTGSPNGRNWQIGLATSTNGRDWQKYAGNPVFGPDPAIEWELEVSDAEVVYENGLYRLWYVSIHETSIPGLERYRIGYASSTDGINWQRRLEPVLRPIPGSWESEGIHSPTVIKTVQGYRMWYMARDRWGIWRAGLADSSDGLTWERSPYNPLNIAGESGFGLTGAYRSDWQDEIYYHRGNPMAIYWATTPDGLSYIKPANNPLLTINQDNFSRRHVGFPAVIKTAEKIRLWYAGHDGNSWRIGYAENPPPVIEPVRDVLIILPGLFASWNREAVLEKKTVSSSQWRSMPFLKEYQGLEKTLENLGYERNKGLFTFYYDWRKSLTDITADFQQYLNTVVYPVSGDKKVSLIGHSLGGLVARTYLQRHHDAKINKVITIGSPNQGVLPVYKAWAGGEVESPDLLTSLFFRFLLAVYKDKPQTGQAVIRENLPILADLLPVFDFLKDKNGNIFSYLNLETKNNTLIDLNSDYLDWQNQLAIVSGNGLSTPAWYQVEPRNRLDEFLKRWPDGVVISEETAMGDSRVLNKSADLAGISNFQFNFDHSEIIYTKEAIAKILELLGITFSEADLIAGERTAVDGALLLGIIGPFDFSVENQTQQFNAEEGLLLLPETDLDSVKVKIHSLAGGATEYQLVTGSLESEWLKFSDSIAAGVFQTYDFVNNLKNISQGQIQRLLEKMAGTGFDRRVKRLLVEGDPKRFLGILASLKKDAGLSETDQQRLELIADQLLFQNRQVTGYQRREEAIAELLHQQTLDLPVETVTQAYALDWAERLLRKSSQNLLALYLSHYLH